MSTVAKRVGLTISLIFLVAAGSSVAVWAWHASRQVGTTPSADIRAISTSITTLEIAELGIKLINIPKEIDDLMYVANAHGNDPEGYSSANFSTASLSRRDENCSPTGGVSDIGMLARVEGMYSQEPYPAYLKQFDEFWIGRQRPQAACSKDSTTEALHGVQIDMFQRLVGNPENIVLLR